MTKILLFAFVIGMLSLSSSRVQAQDSSSDKYKGAVTFGLVHSFNLSSFNGKFENNSYLNRVEEISPVSRITLDFGLDVDYYFSKHASLQFDMLFSAQGAYIVDKTSIYNEVGVFEGQTSKLYSLNYVKFPLMLNIYFKEIFYVNMGGYASALISSRRGQLLFSDDKAVEGVNNFDAGAIGGLGFNLSYVKLGFQYSYGITPAIETDDYSLRNGVFQIVARWKFYSEVRNPRLKN